MTKTCNLKREGRRTLRSARRPRLELLEDRQLLATFTVTDTSDNVSDTGSLRYAITQSNLTGPGPNTIDFNIAGTGVQTITPGSPLAAATVPVTIDGTTQPGYSGTPLIVLVGTNAGVGSNGLALNGADSVVRGLAVDDFQGFGILLGGSGDVITGCFVGVDATGTVAAGNGLGIECAADSITIGGTTAGTRNVISGNGGNGIEFDGLGTSDVVQGNFIGTDVTGTKKLGNNGDCVFVRNPSGILIGGTAPAARNIISGNFDQGVTIDSGSDLVEGNYIGTDVTGTVSLPNQDTGVLLSADNATVANRNSTIGGTAAGAGNVISGNGESGIDVQVNSDDLVEGNFIGTDKTGTVAVPNGSSGIGIGTNPANGFNITIGGTVAAARNIISGNIDAGVALADAGSGNLIEGNYIGTDVTGTRALPNQGGGVSVDGAEAGETIGGTAPGAGNVIAGNDGDGINLFSVNDVLVAGNFIGTDATGVTALPNTGNGVTAGNSGGPSDDTIGGTAAAARNIISGNAENGVVVGNGGDSDDDIVEGNYIGTDVSGETGLGNGDSGILISGRSNTIGGTAAGAGNVISANGKASGASSNDGIWIDSGFGATGNVVQGNLIGTDVTGTLNLGNVGDGVLMASGSNNNTIGGTALNASNVIAFNGDDGVQVDGGSMDLVSQNSIYSNTGLGIRLTNDGNNAQPAPILTSFTTNGASTTVLGTLASAGNTAFILDVYASALGSGESAEEGQNFLTSIPVSTDSAGDAAFTFTVTLPAGETFVTVTATDPENNTSQFSVQETATALSSSRNPSTLGQGVTYTAVVTNPGTGKPTGPVTFTIDGHAESPVSLTVVNGVAEAVFSTATLAVGQHTISASYSGDQAFAPSAPASSLSQTVNPRPLTTTTSLSASPNSSTFGQNVTFTADVASTAIATTAPSGAVTFIVDGQMEPPVDLAEVNGVEQAVFNTATLAVGPHTISASYNGDTTFAASTAPTPVTQTVTTSTTTMLTSSANPSIVGQSVTFTATVASTGGGGTPSGSVSFHQGSTTLRSVSLDGSGRAVFTSSTLALGTDAIFAVYAATGGFLTSNSASVMEVVNPASLQATSTRLASSANPSTAGKGVVFTATVVATNGNVTPAGTVTLTIDGKAGSPAPVTEVNGKDQATFIMPALAPGTYTITASYSGDANFAPSVSTTATQIVDPPVIVPPPIVPSVDGPSVVSVQRFGVHMKPTVLVLAFDQALDATSAENVKDYRVIGPAGRVIGMKSAVYDPKALTVTLRPRERINIHHTFTLIVAGTGQSGLTGANGRLLDGADDGKPGTDLRTPLTWRNLVLTASARWPKRTSAKLKKAEPARLVNH
jgi:hypothetical protein